jgi:hypothetical protein
MLIIHGFGASHISSESSRSKDQREQYNGEKKRHSRLTIMIDPYFRIGVEIDRPGIAAASSIAMVARACLGR